MRFQVDFKMNNYDHIDLSTLIPLHFSYKNKNVERVYSTLMIFNNFRYVYWHYYPELTLVICTRFNHKFNHSLFMVLTDTVNYG